MNIKQLLTKGVVYLFATAMLFTALSCGSGGGGGGDGGGGAKNNTPVANAGLDRSIATGLSVSLDGSGSSDTDGDPLTYSWSLTSRPAGSTASLSVSTTATPAFTPDIDGIYVISLVVNDGTENSITDAVTLTVAHPKITGKAVLPHLSVDAGELTGVYLYDLSWNELDKDIDTDPNYSFTVEAGKEYILNAQYMKGQGFSALVPTVTQVVVAQDITLDTEVAMNLIIAIEQVADFASSSFSRPLDVLLFDANQAVARLNAFLADRNTHRDADRLSDAVRSITLDRLNLNTGVGLSELSETTIRAYGGGIGPLRTLKAILEDPKPPLNPHFTFSRIKGDLHSIGMADIDLVRWDYLGTNAVSPHIPVGGNKVVYTSIDLNIVNAGGYPTEGIYVKEVGSSKPPVRLTPNDLHAGMPVFSPDMTRIAFMGKYVSMGSFRQPNVERKPYNIFVMNSDGSGLMQLTKDTAYPTNTSGAIWMLGNSSPEWSPDGQLIVFSFYDYYNDGVKEFDTSQMAILSPSSSDPNIYDLTYLTDLTTRGFRYAFTPRWSPDGGWIYFSGFRPATDNYMEIYYLDIPQGKFFRYPSGGVAGRIEPAISYDGRFILYTELSSILTLKVMDRYTAEPLRDLGNFANADDYMNPRFTGTESVMVAVSGTTTDSSGNVVVSGTDNRTSTATSSSYNYYREVIPAANQSGINFNVTDW